LVVFALTIACGSAESGQSTTTQLLATTALENPAPTTSTLITVSTEEEISPEVDSVAEEAVADLVARLGIDATAVEVLVAERVTWPDGRMGCPELATPYTLEPIEGFRVVLGHGGLTYHYHAGSDAAPSLCESVTKRARGPGSPEPSIPPPIK
jgi:hypothetical protein